MFNHFRNQARLLNKAANNPQNIEKAKKLKTKLEKIGKPLLIIGAIGDFTSFIVLMIVSFSTFNTKSFNVVGVVVSLVLMIVFGILATCGFSLISISRGINSVTTMQDMIIEEENYENLSQTKECPYCGKKNSSTNNTCESCGANLD